LLKKDRYRINQIVTERFTTAPLCHIELDLEAHVPFWLSRDDG
jgi:hypothetical protein